MGAAAAGVLPRVLFHLSRQQVWSVVGMQNDRVTGACGHEEPISVGVANTRALREHRNGIAGRYE
jgi:hypothetical protein